MSKPYRLTTPRDHNDATNQLNKLFSGLDDDLRKLQTLIPKAFDPSNLQKQINALRTNVGASGGGGGSTTTTEDELDPFLLMGAS